MAPNIETLCLKYCEQRFTNRWHHWLQTRNSRTNLHGPLARYVKLRVVHAPGMPGTFSPPPRVSDTDMHRGTCGTHMLWCMPGSLTSGFLWSRWRGNRSRHFRRMRNAQFYGSGKRPFVPPFYTTSMTSTFSLYIVIVSALCSFPTFSTCQHSNLCYQAAFLTD